MTNTDSSNRKYLKLSEKSFRKNKNSTDIYKKT